MAMVEVSFPGGKKVDAHMKGFTIHTDQPVAAEGENSAPSPFDLFLASIATCAGIYAVSFCQSKELSTEGLKLELDGERDSETGLIGKMTLSLALPEGFPDKYKKAMQKSMELCTVKKHLANPPSFEMKLI
ncbi:OsmC family protein [Tindallia californiensis]|uniref:Ribosomal protein S12 methylthiotransferase accessory factor n=1 Tax=Tindallia californiensis TaxID=159292 RepID=A0A1H3PRL5_9FIRM|nr:OsmC family protein [Tindallia californiensis]SDZ03686.1 ribosomal protein S12 methylthiotransferase accessory factor [Tindallia californiensis]